MFTDEEILQIIQKRTHRRVLMRGWEKDQFVERIRAVLAEVRERVKERLFGLDHEL